jgi:hypothetical protein
MEAAEQNCLILFKNIRNGIIDIIIPEKKYLIINNEDITLEEFKYLFEIIDNYRICGKLNSELNKNFSVYLILKSLLKYIKFNADIEEQALLPFRNDNISLDINETNFLFKQNGATIFSINLNILFDALILGKLLRFVMIIDPTKHKIIIEKLQKLGVHYILSNISFLKDKKVFSLANPVSPVNNGGYRKKTNKNKKLLNKKKLNKKPSRKSRKYNKN